MFLGNGRSLVQLMFITLRLQGMLKAPAPILGQDTHQILWLPSEKSIPCPAMFLQCTSHLGAVKHSPRGDAACHVPGAYGANWILEWLSCLGLVSSRLNIWQLLLFHVVSGFPRPNLILCKVSVGIRWIYYDIHQPMPCSVQLLRQQKTHTSPHHVCMITSESVSLNLQHPWHWVSVAWWAKSSSIWEVRAYYKLNKSPGNRVLWGPLTTKESWSNS